jgi:hypothetical protein
MPIVARDAVLNLRLPKDIKEAVQRAGIDDDGRSISGMAVKILRAWCVANGYLKPAVVAKSTKSKRS